MIKNSLKQVACLLMFCFFLLKGWAQSVDTEEHSVMSLQHAFKSGTISPEIIIQKALKKAEQYKKYNFFIKMDSEKSIMTAASKATLLFRNKKIVGPLQGVPVVIKDNIDVMDYPTTDGTSSLIHHVAQKDSDVVRKLRQAGAIILGKTNMHELAFGATSNNFYFGAVHNPYDYEKFPGGSSGGTAAAIAAGIIPIGIGTDTVGSTRAPAALCGIPGFRPTINRYSTVGVIPFSKTLDTIGTMARTVSDLILLDQIFMSNPVQVLEPYPLKGLRVGVPSNSFLFQNLDPETEQVVNQALKKLKESEVDLIAIDFPLVSNVEIISTFPILVYEVFNDFPLWLKKHVKNITIQELINKIASPDVKAGFMDIWKYPISKMIYTVSLKARGQLQASYIDCFNKYRISAIIFPTTPLPARNIKESVFEVNLNGKQKRTDTIYTRNTIYGSTAGIPGLSIPIGLTKSGLPVGLEIDGLSKDDMNILRIGLAFESLFGRLKRPVL